MGFFTPWFLAGVVGVGLPIWLHLLKRHKTDPRMFPSLMFFEPREQSSVMHKRLDYILLFILRTAMLVLLALLFANPFIRWSTPKASGKKIVVVAVDRSFSMRATSGGESRLDKAKREALSVLSSIPATTAAQVVSLSTLVQAMTGQTNDPSELRAGVVAIQQDDGRASFGELAQFSRTLTESTKTPIEVHLISDLQKSALPPGFIDLRLDQDTTLVFHPVGGEVPNWTVENVVSKSRVYDTKKFRVQATIAGFAAPAAKRTVSLVLNGKVVHTKPVDVPAGGRTQVEFIGLEASYGFNKCEIRIDGADALPADDRFVFSVERADPKKILFVDDGRSRAPLYFRTALDASADAAFTLDVQRPEVPANATLSNYATVVLSNPGKLPGNLEEALKRYVNAGGSMLVALGTSSAVLTQVPVAEETIEATRYAGREDERFLTVTDVDKSFLGAVQFDGVRFFQVIHVKPGKSRVMVRLNDQTPLLMDRQVGEGKVLIFASPFDNVTNDFPVHNSWVPFVQQTTSYLGGGGVEQPVNLSVGSYVELRTGVSKSAAAEILDPDGKRMLTLEEATTAKNFALPKEGFFELKTATGRHSFVAVHADRRESDLSVIPQENLDLWRGTGAGNPGGGAAGNAQSEETKKPLSISPYLLLLLLGVVLAESVVANRYLRPAADGQPEARKEAA